MNYFLLLGIIALLIGLFLDALILYFSYLFLLIHIIFKLYAYYLKRKIEITQKLKSNRIFYKETVSWTISISNQGFLPVIWLKFKISLPVNLALNEKRHFLLSLGAEEKIKKEFKLKGRKRGYYKIGSLSWETGDIIGYSPVGEKKEIAEEILVYPKIFSLKELGLPSNLPLGEIKWFQSLYKDPNQIAGIREYSPEDRFKDIHWKATAKTGEIQVKTYESTVDLETILILNLNQNDYDTRRMNHRIELAITTAASIACHLNEIGQPYSFLTNGDDVTSEYENNIFLKSGRGDNHLKHFLEILAKIEKSEEDKLLSLFNIDFDLCWGATIIIITSRDNEELLTHVFSLIRNGYNVKIIVVGDRIVHKQYSNLPLTAPLTIFRIEKGEDLYEL